MSARGRRLVSLHDDAVAAALPAIRALLGGVFFVLLIACANVASLQLVRAAGRRRELAVRSALGGSGLRRAGPFLAEGLLLGCAGGLLGLLAAAWILDLMAGRLPASLPRAEEIGLDGRILSFGVALALAAGIVFGLAPLAEGLRRRVAEHLRVARSVGEAAPRLRRLLVAAEVAAAIVLLVGAGLCLESFRRLRAVDPGYQTAGVLTARLNLPRSRYGAPEKIASFARGGRRGAGGGARDRQRLQHRRHRAAAVAVS